MRARRAIATTCAGILAAASTLVAQEPVRPGSVSFTAAMAPDTVYVGQQATYSLTVRIPTEIRQRLRRNPEFVPPEPRAMLAYDLPLAREPATAEEVEVHVYRRALFALTPGRYTIPVARLTYALPQSPSFFSREEERTLRSAGVTLVAIDPPLSGRPAEWLGAVGRWRVRARLDAARARVGDPLVLVLRVEGEGNATLLPRPPLEIAWADVVASDERITLDTTPTALTGAKEFHWLVTPREDGTRSVPPLEYVSFDPIERRYVVGRSEPLRVVVQPGDRVVLPPRPALRAVDAPVALRPALEGASQLRPRGTGWWIWIALLTPLLWLALRVAATRTDPRDGAHEPTDPATGRGAFDTALRERTGIEPAMVTTPGALTKALRLEGVTSDAATEAEALRDLFDAASFSPGHAAPAAAEPVIRALTARASVLLARIDREARRRGAALLLAFAGLGAVVGCRPEASANEPAVLAFAEGRTAYAGKEYARAQDAFHRAARSAPRDASAWANLGAAAWQAGDSAVAVLGWQRALRLDPTDRELRSALTRVRAPQTKGDARVWPVPPLPIASLALILWMTAWMLSIVLRDGRVPRAPRAVLIVPALLLAIGAAWLDDRLAARDLAVVAAPTPLRSLPALGADAGPVPLVGEIARIVERRGVWLRLELAGERGGWYPADRTHALARD